MEYVVLIGIAAATWVVFKLNTPGRQQNRRQA